MPFERQLLLFQVLFTCGCYCLNPYQNIALPFRERVEDLINRLTTDEIIDQLSHGGAGKYNGPAPAIPRLGVPPHAFNTECLRGDVNAGAATAFPQAIGLASSFSRNLVYDVATATSIEVRAKNNNYTANGDFNDHHGLSCFSPVINIMRHPTWGRNQETYGEDPYLSGQLAGAFVRGLQGSHPRYIRANAGCKHFNVHGGPENLPESRFSFNSKVSKRDWRMTFLPQFRDCVRAGSYSLMCSYNSINGVPACANEELLTRILRDEWGFTGYVVSDETAVENVYSTHKYTKDFESAAVACLKAGTNLELAGPGSPGVYNRLKQALSSGNISKSLLLERVRPLFYTRMKLGELDPADMNPYKQLRPEDYIQSREHRNLAEVAAIKSFVLLKNNGALPILQKLQRIAVVGPFANQGTEVYGDYAPTPDPSYMATVLDSVSDAGLASITTSGGLCTPPQCADYNSTQLREAVAGASLVLICAGTGSYEQEGRDRPDMKLPGRQQTLLNDVINYVPSGTRIVLLLFSAGPLQLPDSVWQRADAAFQLHFPAQSTGDAVVSVLIGKTNPAGRLAYTWYRELSQVPNMTNYTMQERTYRYMWHQKPLFPFGFGLSYSKFQYSNLKIHKRRINAGEDLKLSVEVQNTGGVAGDEVIQVYVSWSHDERELHPIRQLVGFDRVFLQASQRTKLKFAVESERYKLCNNDGICSVAQGSYKISAGGQQPDQNVNLPSNVLSEKFYVID